MHHPDDALAWLRNRRTRPVMVVSDQRASLELIRDIKEQEPHSVALAVVEKVTTKTLSDALECGGDGVAPRSSSPEELVGTLVAAVHGHVIMPAPVARDLSSRIAEQEGLPEDLPSNQAELLQCLVDGHSVAEAAAALHCSERTMFRVQRRLFDRLGVDDRVQAVLRANRAGWGAKGDTDQ